MPAALLFDLDGTLVDSIELILSSGRHAFIGFGGRPPSDEEWRASIGRPLEQMFRAIAPDDAEVARLVERYRAFQHEHHDRLLRAYAGVVPLLAALSAHGHPLALVTSKGEELARRALAHVGLTEMIPVVVGLDSCTRHKPDPEPVLHALALLGVSPADAVFVGDSTHDMEAGRSAGVRTIGVTWGACTREQLETSGADIVVDDVAGLGHTIREIDEG